MRTTSTHVPFLIWLTLSGALPFHDYAAAAIRHHSAHRGLNTDGPVLRQFICRLAERTLDAWIPQTPADAEYWRLGQSVRPRPDDYGSIDGLEALFKKRKSLGNAIRMYDNNMGLDGQAQTTFKDLCELLGTRPTSKSAKPLFRKLETLLMAGADHQLESTHPDAADNGAETPTPWTTNTLVQTEPENQNAVVRLTGGPQPIGLPTLPHETARTQLTRLIGKLWPLEETLWKSTHCRHSASLIKLLPTLQTKSGVLARAIYSENYEDELDARWLRSAYEDLITYIQGLISMKIEIEEYLVYRTGVNLTRLGHLHSVCDHLKGLVHLHSKALPRNILKLIETTAEHDGKLVDHWSLILDTSCDSIAAMDMAVRLPRLSPTAQRLVQCPCMPDLSPDMRLALQGSHLPALLMEARPLQSPRRKR